MVQCETEYSKECQYLQTLFFVRFWHLFILWLISNDLVWYGKQTRFESEF